MTHRATARRVYVNGRAVTLDSSTLVGQGGEAEVFDLRREFPTQAPLALKVWMPPDHPAFAGTDREAVRNRKAAGARIREYGEKLAAFPAALPKAVIGPEMMATDDSRAVVGYAMQLIEGAEPLRMFGQRHFRTSRGIDPASVLRIFTALHTTVRALHRARVVIGDFNYLNVLVRDEQPYLIDADSFQFGRWFCRGFTTRFVDPLICDSAEKLPVQVKPHSPGTDWYAYALMLFECLMFVGPYGGVYHPTKKSDLIPEDARPLKRISVFNPQVIYPQKAQPLSWLPPQVGDFYGKLLVEDWRGEFPEDLLALLLAHAEGRAYNLHPFAPAAHLVEQVRGSVRMKRVYQEPGSIVSAALNEGRLALLRYQNGTLLREDGTAVLTTPPDPDLFAATAGARTILVKGGTLVVLSPGADPQCYAVDLYQRKLPVFGANARHCYWLSDGILYRDDLVGPRAMGNMLKNQSRIFVGPRFGIGFSRVGAELQGYVFDAERPGINDQVTLPSVRGEIIDSTCFFSSNRAWLFMTVRVASNVVNRCVVIRPDGKLSGAVEAPEGSSGWLGSIRGKCAVTLSSSTHPEQALHRLFSITDDGLVGVDDNSADSNGIPPTEAVLFPDTKSFVEHDATLLPGGANSVLQVSKKGVWQIVFA